MTLAFMKNLYLGSSLSEEELKDIPNPRAELHFHVLNKNIQVQNLINTHLETNYKALYFETNFKALNFALQFGCLVGGFLGALRGLVKHRSLKSMLSVAYRVFKKMFVRFKVWVILIELSRDKRLELW